jgi:hypothetical protein
MRNWMFVLSIGLVLCLTHSVGSQEVLRKRDTKSFTSESDSERVLLALRDWASDRQKQSIQLANKIVDSSLGKQDVYLNRLKNVRALEESVYSRNLPILAQILTRMEGQNRARFASALVSVDELDLKASTAKLDEELADEVLAKHEALALDIEAKLKRIQQDQNTLCTVTVHTKDPTNSKDCSNYRVRFVWNFNPKDRPEESKRLSLPPPQIDIDAGGWIFWCYRLDKNGKAIEGRRSAPYPISKKNEEVDVEIPSLDWGKAP